MKLNMWSNRGISFSINILLNGKASLESMQSVSNRCPIGVIPAIRSIIESDI